MSLRGRYIIDRIKRVVSSHLKMPVPPYGNPLFWENVYQKMETASAKSMNPETGQLDFDDAFEWGGVTLSEHLLDYHYRQITIDAVQGDYAAHSQTSTELLTTTLGDTLGVQPLSKEALLTEDHPKEPILMLGCGNSKMGEEMVQHGWRGPIVQLDICQAALEMIVRRTQNDHHLDRLEFVKDDATHLNSIPDGSMHATIDKGLIDALFCADEHSQLTDILQSVLRVLQPAGVFCIFSRSRPEFLLPKLLPMKQTSAYYMRPGKPTWAGLQMQELDHMLIYRFQKSDPAGYQEPPKRKGKTKKKSSQRRQQ